MKRSEVNFAIEKAKKLFKENNFHLPEFASYTEDDWKILDLDSCDEILNSGLGWDVTDLATGDFKNIGLTLFTIRNQSDTNCKPYAEKIMMSEEEQVTPMHYHWNKMEDIINRGGGNLMVVLYHRDEETDLLDKTTPVTVSIDGRRSVFQPGEKIRLKAGQSICLTTGIYHSFWAEKGFGSVMVGEVSMANDDVNDNRFLKPLGRFTDIEEDTQFTHLLCSDYQSYFDL
jgi:D-lyxose ketol-isomerase